MEHAHTHEHHDHQAHDHAHEHDHSRERLMLWIKTALLIGLGAYFTYNILSGNLANYINERFAWLSYLAAAIFLVLGIYNLTLALRADDAYFHKHDDDGHEGHDHSALSWGTVAVIAVPLVLGTLIPSRPLGADAIDGSVNTSTAAGSMTTFTLNPLDRNVLDWLRYFGTLDDYAEITGQPADVIGFVYKEPTFGADQFMVARFTVSCCVADASAIGVPIRWQGAGEVEHNTWVRVQGAFEVADFRGDTLPVLQAASVTFIDQPEHPYLYP